MTSIEAADKAHRNYDELVKCKYYAAANFLKMGELLKESHDNAYWKILGYEDWASFLGSPDIGMKEKWAYTLIQVYSTFVLKLGRDQKELVGIDISKLALIVPVAETNPDEWLGKARNLSKSDLKIELGRGPVVKNKPLPSLSSFAGPRHCCVCGNNEWEKSHFPISRGAGGEEVKDWWIPLCRKCHSEFHQDPKEWTWTYKRNWARYLYGFRRSD